MESHKYKLYRLPKGGCKFREIYIPEPDTKRTLRTFLPTLHKIATELDVNNVCHAFMKGRNCVTNALQHIGYRYTVSLDIKDFFDSVRTIHLAGKVPNHILSYCLIDGAPRQGLPTSPLIANIALTDTDRQIHESLKFLKTPFTYTRYADDLTVSVDDKKAVPKIIYLLRQILTQQGFVINEQKTLVQSSANGRRIVTGIGVDECGLHPTRKTRRAIRAANHQKHYSSARGLLEWSLCKMPGQRKLKVPEMYRYRVGQKEVECSSCGQGGLVWYKQNNDRYMLVNTQNGIQHLCPSRPLPINKIDLEHKLRDQGFKEIQLLSKTWSKGFSRASSCETLLVLFRKRGIDICWYVRAKHFFPIELPLSLEKNPLLYRFGYNSHADNLHALVWSLAQKFSAGESVNLILRNLFWPTCCDLFNKNDSVETSEFWLDDDVPF